MGMWRGFLVAPNQELKTGVEGNSTPEVLIEDKPSSIETLIEAKTINDNHMDRLAHAIAVAETGDCTTGMGATKNNCFGIMEWPAWNNYKRVGKTYNSKAEAYDDFKRIWTQYYGSRYPTWNDAVKWTGNNNPTTWLNNVKSAY